MQEGEEVKIRSRARALLDNTHGWRNLVLMFSCIVVFVTTYLLIMPAFTLDKELNVEKDTEKKKNIGKELNDIVLILSKINQGGYRKLE